MWFLPYGPRQANLVLIAYASSEVQASLRIRAVWPEPPLLAHTSSESRGIFRQKARSLASLNGWACAVKICYDGMLEDTNSLDAPHMVMHPKDADGTANRVHIKILWLIISCRIGDAIKNTQNLHLHLKHALKSISCLVINANHLPLI